MKTPLDIYLQRHSPLSPELWLHYSRLSVRYNSRHVPGAGNLSLIFLLIQWIKSHRKNTAQGEPKFTLPGSDLCRSELRNDRVAHPAPPAPRGPHTLAFKAFAPVPSRSIASAAPMGNRRSTTH